MSFFNNIHIKYWLFWLSALPDLPLMYFHGKETKKRVPELPDATDNEGKIIIGKSRYCSVLYLGESTIAGVGVDSHKNGFVGNMSRELAGIYDCNIEYRVIAKSGWKASDLIKRLKTWQPEKAYQLIIIGLGGNDSFKFTSPGKWQHSIAELILLIKKKCPNTPILFCNLPPTSEFIAFPPILKNKIGKMTEMLRLSLNELMDDYDDVFFNDEIISLMNWSERNNLKPNPALYFSDGIHPSQLTYQIWAKEMASFAKSSKITI